MYVHYGEKLNKFKGKQKCYLNSVGSGNLRIDRHY